MKVITIKTIRKWF